MEINSSGIHSHIASSIQSTNESLSSGKRINHASDGPAEHQIIEQFSSQIQGNSAAQRNIIDGTSALQIAQGGLSQVNDSLQQLRELGIQAGNGTLNASDRKSIQGQANELLSGIKDMLQNSQFNGKSSLNNSEAQEIQTGANANNKQTLPSFDLATDFTDAGLFDIDFESQDVSDALNSIDKALNISDSASSAFGSAEQSLEFRSRGLATSSLNQAQARSQIQDTDYAAATSEQAKLQVQENVEIAMLAQANARRGDVLSLLNIN